MHLATSKASLVLAFLFSHIHSSTSYGLTNVSFGMRPIFVPHILPFGSTACMVLSFIISRTGIIFPSSPNDQIVHPRPVLSSERSSEVAIITSVCDWLLYKKTFKQHIIGEFCLSRNKCSWKTRAKQGRKYSWSWNPFSQIGPVDFHSSVCHRGDSDCTLRSSSLAVCFIISL